jgi:hypothetical protein
LDVRIDTGATFPLSDDSYLNLTQSQAELLRLTGDPIKVLSATGTGDAVLKLPVYSLASLEIGRMRLTRVYAIVQPRVGYFARPDAVGFLGNSVLDKLDPFFDYQRGVFGLGRS